MIRRYDGQNDDARRARRATVKKVEGAPKRELPEEPGKSQPAKSPTEESLLLSWLCERVDSSISRKEDRTISRNLLRANVAALLHGKAEGLPGLMTIVELVEYAESHPDDVDLEIIREKVNPRWGRRVCSARDMFWAEASSGRFKADRERHK
jgi:hypothetical protein